MSPEFLGYIYLFLRIGVSTIYNACVKILKKNYSINAVDIVFYSSIFGILFLILLYPKREKIFKVDKSQKTSVFPLIFASFFGGSLYSFFYNKALETLPMGKVSVIYYIYPVFLYIIGSLIIDKNSKKAFEPKILIGIFMCLLGVFCTCYNDLFSPAKASRPEGYIFAAISALCIILFSLIAKKYKIDTYWFLLIGQIMGFAMASFSYIKKYPGFNIPFFTGIPLVMFVLFGIFSNDLREFFRIKSIEYLPISKISTWNYFSPAMNGLSGILFFGDKMTKFDYAAYTLVIIGNLISNSKKGKSRNISVGGKRIRH